MTLNFGNNLFPSRNEILGSYDYFDVASLTGYKLFYVARANAGEYIVTTNSNMGSEVVETTGATNTNTETINEKTYYPNVQETTIDLKFNKAVNIKGDMFFNIPIGHEEETIRRYYLCRVKMYHYNGIVETQIGSTTISQEYSYDSDAPSDKGNRVALACIKIDTINNYHFKDGDILRMKLTILCTSPGTTFVSGFAHDPINRAPFGQYPDQVFNTIGDITRFTWIIPFKLEI